MNIKAIAITFLIIYMLIYSGMSLSVINENEKLNGEDHALYVGLGWGSVSAAIIGIIISAMTI